MGVKKVHEKLDELFKDKKSRSFLNHLVKNYFPITNVKLVQSSEKNIRCVLCKESLITLSEIPEESLITDKEFDEVYFEGHPYHSRFNKRGLAVIGKDTNTSMSYKTYVHFYDWVVMKTLSGDKHMGWLLKGMNWDDLIPRAEQIDDEQTQKRVARYKKNKGDINTTYTLGDLDSLMELKKKFQ